MNRKREQAELIFLLGQVLGPVLKAAESPDRYDADERMRIQARFAADLPAFFQACVRFCQGEPGHVYARQIEGIVNSYNHLLNIVPKEEINKAMFDRVIIYRDRITEEVLSVPVPFDSTIYEGRTQFSTYCFVKDLCSTVKTQVVWLDRYFDQTIFHRFFTDTPKTAQVTLVTLPGAHLKGKGDLARHAEFMDVSKLFAAERGPQGYRLVENANFHDRWLRCDERLFTLGGSIKDLSKPFTISRLDSSPENLKHFNDAVTSGTEVFGPAQIVHP